jgi:parvulin-like peptidyl-prolyl isomerase
MTKRRARSPNLLSRAERSRAERETRQRKILYLVAGLTVVSVLAVLAVGLYQEYVAKPGAPVATVDGAVITTRYYQERVRLRRAELGSLISEMQRQLQAFDPTVEGQQYLIEYFQGQLEQYQAQASNVAFSTLDEVIDEEFIRQEATRRGLTASAEEVQATIEEQFGYVRNPPTPAATPITVTVATTLTATPSPTVMTEEMFDTNYGEYVSGLVKTAGVSEAHFRGIFEVGILRSKLQLELAEEVPRSAEQVHARHILVETEEGAQQALERLKAGEDFAEVAKEVSADTSNNEQGGDLGWFIRGQMVPEFEEAAFALQPGETSGIVESTYGYHIINLVERDADRPLDEATLTEKKASALTDWLTEQRESDRVESFWSSKLVPPA